MDIQKIVNECKERGTVRVKFNSPKPLNFKCGTNEIYRISERYAAEIVNAQEECYVRAVIQAVKEAGVTTLDLIDKEFIVSGIRHEQERRQNKQLLQAQEISKSDIERLKTQLQQANAGIVNCSGCHLVELNAVKEFVEKLKAKAHSVVGFNVRKKVYVKKYTINEIDIDELLKEYEQ